MSVHRNTAYNVVGSTVPVAAMIVAVPPYLEAIGDERYGVLAVLWTLLGYMGLFDLGLGRAVTNRIAALAQATAESRETVFWTALGLNLGLGLGAGLALWGVASVVFGSFVEVPAALGAELEVALPWMALAFPLLLTSSVMSGALMGREQFLHQNAVRVGEGALVQLAPLTVALTVGPELRGLVLTVLAVRLTSSVALFVLCLRRLPVRLRPRVDRAEVRPLFVYGGWVTVTSAIGPLLSTLDRVLIGTVSGVKAVTHYTVPYGVVTQASILPGSLTSALFPRFSAQDDPVERSTLQLKGTQSVAAAMTPLIVVGLLLIEPVVGWWLADKPDVAAAAGPIAILLLPGVWFNGLAYVPYARLQGEGRPDLVAKAHLAELAPYLVALWFALQAYGALGAAAVWSLRTTADMVLLTVWSRVPLKTFTELAGPGALVVAALAVALLGPAPIPRTVVGAPIVVLSVWNAYRRLSPLVRGQLQRPSIGDT